MTASLDTWCSVKVHETDLQHAMIGLGLPPTVSKSGVIRAALAFLKYGDRDKAKEYAFSGQTPRDLKQHGTNPVSFKAGSDLLDQDALKVPQRRSHAIRVALLTAAYPNLDPRDIETYATRARGPKPKSVAA